MHTQAPLQKSPTASLLSPQAYPGLLQPRRGSREAAGFCPGCRGPFSVPAAMPRGAKPSGSVPCPPPAGRLRRGARLRRRRHFLSAAPGRFPRRELPVGSRRPPRCPSHGCRPPSRPAAGSPGRFPLAGGRRRRAPHTGAGPRTGWGREGPDGGSSGSLGPSRLGLGVWKWRRQRWLGVCGALPKGSLIN